MTSPVKRISRDVMLEKNLDKVEALFILLKKGTKGIIIKS
jgi:hypothetical protein